MSQFNTKYYPNLFEMGGAFTRAYKRSIDSLDRSNIANGIYQFHEVAKEVSAFLRTDKSGPWPAIVLAVEEIIYDGKEGSMGLVNNYSMRTPTAAESKPEVYIKVYARRMPDDQSIPQPDFAYMDPAWTNAQRPLKVTSCAQRMAIIRMHPFYLVSKEKWGERRMPEPLDVISVTFDDKINQVRGRVVDFLEKGNLEPAACTSFYDEPGTPAPSSGAAAHQDPLRPIGTVGGTDAGPKLRSPPPDLWAEANVIVDNMAPGPDVENPNDFQFIQSSVQWKGATIQTVMWDNGRPIYKAVAPYLVAMFIAAKRDGVAMSLSSGYRHQFDDLRGSSIYPYLVDDMGNSKGYVGWNGAPLSERRLNKFRDNPTKSFAASQAECRRQNCTPVDKALTREAVCDPATGFPTTTSNSQWSHGSGFAFDISSGMKDTKTKPQPDSAISKQVRWLSNNAWKFGFLRDVSTERWHYSFRLFQTPIPHMFNHIRGGRQSGSWDGQFLDGVPGDPTESDEIIVEPGTNPNGPPPTA